MADTIQNDRPWVYGFEIGFDSSIRIGQMKDPTQSIAASFGYITNDNRPGRQGEVSRLVGHLNSRVAFQIYDLNSDPNLLSQFNTPGNPYYIQQVTIQFDNRDGNPGCPFNWDKGQMTFSNPRNAGYQSGNPQVVNFTTDALTGHIQSAGLNINDAYAGYLIWDGGGTSPQQTQFLPINKGEFEFTVTITMGDGRTFRVDPEMDIEGAG